MLTNPFFYIPSEISVFFYMQILPHSLPAAVLPFCHFSFHTISLFCMQPHKHHPSHLLSVTVSPSPPSLSFGPCPVCLVLGNITPLLSQSPTNPHALPQQHIAGVRENHSPPVCLCVGRYMIASKYVCLFEASTGVCGCVGVCLHVHVRQSRCY